MTENANSQQILPVVIAGGTGSRLWPLSRELYPKQFLALDQERSMLQVTLKRLEGLSTQKPLVICNEAHRFLVADQLQQMDLLGGNVLLEPVGRNTAPAVALAAIRATASGQDPLMLVLAADHSIRNIEAFQTAIQKAVPAAMQGAMVTFGIVPNAPETGYGYIHMGTEVAQGIHKVNAFVEKPSSDVAAQYIASQQYLWNSGMFLFKASKFLSELICYRPDIHEACIEAMKSPHDDMDFVRINKEAFLRCPSDSIDYAVMEKTVDAVVVPMDAGWSDIGAFGALWEILPHDEAGNVQRGNVVAIDSSNNLILAEDALVATVGVNNMVIVQTKDALLVVPRDRTQDVKNIVNRLKSEKRPEYQLHKQVFRPWGKYQSVDDGNRYQVKRITVKPGGKLSVQMHHHRAEHWIVVTGTAQVTLNGNTRLLTENESIYLPLGATHCLENPGKIPLELIEVQVGSYLGEDDIVRFEDQYGRS